MLNVLIAANEVLALPSGKMCVGAGAGKRQVQETDVTECFVRPVCRRGQHASGMHRNMPCI